MGGRVGKILTTETMVRTTPLAVNPKPKLNERGNSHDVQEL